MIIFNPMYLSDFTMETPTAPELGGPDRHHVYIDSHEHDIERYDELRDILEEDGMTIYKNDEGLSESMEDGVDGSRKVRQHV